MKNKLCKVFDMGLYEILLNTNIFLKIDTFPKNRYNLEIFKYMNR